MKTLMQRLSDEHIELINIDREKFPYRGEEIEKALKGEYIGDLTLSVVTSLSVTLEVSINEIWSIFK